MNESDPRSNVHYLSISFTSLSAVQIYDFHIFLTVHLLSVTDIEH